MNGKRDRAPLVLMSARGLRRHEVVTLRVEDLQREEHWVIVDLVGRRVIFAPFPCLTGYMLS